MGRGKRAESVVKKDPVEDTEDEIRKMFRKYSKGAKSAGYARNIVSCPLCGRTFELSSDPDCPECGADYRWERG